jgi:hypothetical protein
MEKGTWLDWHKNGEWCNASKYYAYDYPDHEYLCLLKKDKTDKKWYCHTAQEDTDAETINKTWIPLDVSNAREAKKVVEVMARME